MPKAHDWSAHERLIAKACTVGRRITRVYMDGCMAHIRKVDKVGTIVAVAVLNEGRYPGVTVAWDDGSTNWEPYSYIHEKDGGLEAIH